MCLYSGGQKPSERPDTHISDRLATSSMVEHLPDKEAVEVSKASLLPKRKDVSGDI